MDKLCVAILVFDQVEVLDFAGPYEVFSRTRTVPGSASRRSDESAPFRVLTVAGQAGPVCAVGGLRLLPDHTFADAPAIDLLVVPGGFGVRALLEDAETSRWVRATAGQARLVTSVCTGALLLARLGLLAGRRATTHWGLYDTLRAIDPSIDVREDERVVEDVVVTSGGVAAGIDMAFHVVEKLCGREVADETARYIDYPRSRP